MFTEVAESGFPFFHGMTNRERLGKTKMSYGEDVYIRPWSLSHNLCRYIYLIPVVIQLIPLWLFRQNVLGAQRVNSHD